MSSFSTIGDSINALTGTTPNTFPLEPTLEELNAGDIEPFVVPSDSSIQSLKQQLSYEAWLYMMGVDPLGVKYNRRLGEQEMQQHLVRVIALLDFKDKSIPFDATAVRARISW